MTAGSRPSPAAVFAAAVAVILTVLYVAALRLPAAGLFHDDAIYTVTARALAEGRGYHIVSLPGEPPQTKYPPLFPALLATAWAAAPGFPGNLWLLKLVPLAGALAWLLLTWRLYRALGMSDTLRRLAVVSLAALPWVLYLATTLLSETVFAALCTATLLCLESDDAPPSPSRVVAAATLAAAAVLTRTIGVALPAAITAWLLCVRRAPRQASLFLGVTGGLLIPWAVWVMAAPDAGYYGAVNYASWNVLSANPQFDLAMRLRVLLTNLLWTGSAPVVALGAPGGVVSTALAIAVIAPGLTMRTVRRRVTTWFVVLYLALVIGWVWPPERFVVVVMPLLLWVALAGIPRTRAGTIAAAVALTVATAALVPQLVTMVGRGRRSGTLSIAAGPERWTDIVAASQWIVAHTEKGELLAGNLDPLIYLLTDRKAVRGFEANPFDLFYAGRNTAPLGSASRWFSAATDAGVTVVVDSPDPFFAEGPYLKAIYRELESRGDLYAVGQTGAFRFLRLRGPATPARSNRDR